jgi:hypothetical protein
VFGLGAVVWFGLGIASVTTMAIGLIVTIVFIIRASLGYQNPLDIWYGIIASLFLIWALRPNIKKLVAGQERVVKFSLNGWLKARKELPTNELIDGYMRFLSRALAGFYLFVPPMELLEIFYLRDRMSRRSTGEHNEKRNLPKMRFE